MNILNKLTIKNIKLNRKRTISTIIGITLSCALICAVATMVTSFKKTLVQNSINDTGYYHIKISNLQDADVSKIENNRNIKEVFTVSNIGYGKLDNSQNEYKQYLKLISMNSKTFETLKFNLVEGRFPLNNNEVVISKHIIDNAKVDYKIGDKIKIAFGKRMSLDGYELADETLYNKEDEQIVNAEEFEFTIVGIIERPDYSFESYSSAAYTIISTDIASESKEVFGVLKEPKNYKQAISNILGANSYTDVINYIEEGRTKLKYESFSINEELLRWEVMAFTNSTVTMLYSVAFVVIFIIIFTSVFCIRNSFAISISEKYKMYGMLSSIGATKKQIKKNVIFEAMAYGLVRNTTWHIIRYICSICAS